MQVDRRLITHFDRGLFGVAFALALLSAFAVYSATRESAFRQGLYLKQLLWILVGLLALFLALSFSPRTVERFSYPLFALSLLTLALVPFFGRVGLGAQRWIKVGPFAFQPSEFVKVSLILFLAKYFEDHKERLEDPKVFLLPALFTLFPIALILKQPDLGTAFLLLLLSLSMMLLVGLKPRHLLPFLLASVTSAPLLWGLLKGYQKRRILVFLNPSLDPLGAGYHVAQSKIAVGSGMFLGKGFFNATQSQLRFLPESHTDFIFATLAEQWGFLGSLLLLLAYAYLISKGLEIAREAQDLFTALLSFGITTLLALHVLSNVGMVTGILPVVGIPLPLLSYGGSSMVATMLALGLLLSVRMRRFRY